MKKLFIFLLALSVSVSSFAYYGETRLVVSSYSQRNISVYVDGISKGTSYNNSVSISDLYGGSHNVKIYQEQKNFWGRTSYRLLYESNLYLRPDYETTLLVNGDNNVSISERRVYSNNGGYGNGNGGYGNGNNGCDNGGGYGNGNRGRHRGWNKDKWKREEDRDHDNGRGYDRNRDDNYYDGTRGNDRQSGYQGMNQQIFEQFKQSIRNATFDDSKQNVAKQGMATNYFTASQVKEIVQLFSFDDSKLAMAKYAYSRCVDKQSYFVVSDALTFSSSKDELARFIQQSGR